MAARAAIPRSDRGKPGSRPPRRPEMTCSAAAELCRERGFRGSEARARIVRRQRAIVDAWVEALVAVRPELSPAEALAVAIGVAALLNAASRVRGLRPDAKAALFRRMALAALLARG